MQQMSRSFFRPAWRNARPSAAESEAPPATSAPEPYIRHRPTEAWELQRIEAALLIPPDEADTLKAVCTHITQHSGDPSSRALAGLVRALYQDTGTFDFESLDCLGPLMRRHAERLISARLWSALTDHEWQQAYAAVASYEFKDNVAKLARAAEASPEKTLVSETRLAGASKAPAEVKASFDAKSAAESKAAVEAKSVEPKMDSQPEPALESKHISESKPTSEPKSAPEPKLASEPKSAPEPKLASEPKPALGPGVRRDEARALAKVPSIGAASPNAVLPTSGTSVPSPSRLPHEIFPHADSFNLENIGRHWRVVLWFAMAAVGLVVVTYI